MALLVTVLLWSIRIFTYLIIASVLMSWVPNAKESSIGQFITKLTDPYLSFFRKYIPLFGVIDVSPIVAILVLSFVSQGIVNLYYLV